MFAHLQTVSVAGAQGKMYNTEIITQKTLLWSESRFKWKLTHWTSHLLDGFMLIKGSRGFNEEKAGSAEAPTGPPEAKTGQYLYDLF